MIDDILRPDEGEVFTNELADGFAPSDLLLVGLKRARRSAAPRRE